MRAFAVQLKNGNFIKDERIPINLGAWNPQVKNVDDIDNAKHWENKSVASRWIQSRINTINKKIAESQSEHDRISSTTYTGYNPQWQLQSCKNRIAKCNDIIAIVNTCNVIQIDADEPNFPNKKRLRFRGRNESPSNNMHLHTESTSKYTCDSCSVVLKDIPFYNIGYRNIRVCIPCLHLRQDNIVRAYETMPEDYRTEFTNELLIGAI